jgi:hypothetical protein
MLTRDNSLRAKRDNGFSRWRWGGIETSALRHSVYLTLLGTTVYLASRVTSFHIQFLSGLPQVFLKARNECALRSWSLGVNFFLDGH